MKNLDELDTLLWDLAADILAADTTSAAEEIAAWVISTLKQQEQRKAALLAKIAERLKQANGNPVHA